MRALDSKNFTSSLTMIDHSSALLSYKIASKPNNNEIVWKQTDLRPFDELLISWCGRRPEKGFYKIEVSVFTDRWSPFLPYAVWGDHYQYTFNHSISHFKTHQDTFEILDGKKANGFQIHIRAYDGASIYHLHALYACATDLKAHAVAAGISKNLSIKLLVPKISQLAIVDSRSRRICSPVSTTAILRYLLPDVHVDPLSFADAVYDKTFDIYGNWILNTAQASHLLGPSWHSCVARFSGFSQILSFLEKNYPVVVSVKSPLPGSTLPYTSGHLIVVRGYDAQTQTVLCMDPAFSEDEHTYVNYRIEDFLAAWNRRHGVVYLFFKEFNFHLELY
jgi:hypothetical protein